MNPHWLAALAFNVLLVAALALTAFLLECAGFCAVAHDEQRLAEPLQTALEEDVPLKFAFQSRNISVVRLRRLGPEKAAGSGDLAAGRGGLAEEHR